MAQGLQSHLGYKMGCDKMVRAGQWTNESESAADAKADPGACAWISRPVAPLRGVDEDAAAPLSGLSFAVKDNIDVLGLETTVGCPAFAYWPAAHATVVQRLLDAGASVLGKTNLDQFACGLSGTRSPYGVVPNSFDAAYCCGGSSSGSAYVVATGQADFSLGTDTAGSGRVPAGLNNIVGLKPTRGLLSARGVQPAMASVDCVSIFARSVGTAVRVLELAQGHDPGDPYSRRLRLDTRPFPANFRFGVPDRLEFFGDTLAESAFRDARQALRLLGGSEVIIDYAPLAQAADMLYGSALVAERYSAIKAFFDRSEAQLVQPVRDIIGKGRGHSAADLAAAQSRVKALAQQADGMWRGIDVLLVPTAPTHYRIEQMLADPVRLNRNLGAYTNFVNLFDYAAISVPSAIRPDGLPFGITLIGPACSDLRLADLGQRYHHARGLNQGALALPLPEPRAVFPPAPPPGLVRVAVVGAHLSGMPLNGQLLERGATLVQTTRTAPVYELFALQGTLPPKPGMARARAGEGAAIEVEVWEMPMAHYGSFVAGVPAPLCIGTIALADGGTVQGFLCEAQALESAIPITRHGGWRAWLASQAATREP